MLYAFRTLLVVGLCAWIFPSALVAQMTSAPSVEPDSYSFSAQDGLWSGRLFRLRVQNNTSENVNLEFQADDNGNFVGFCPAGQTKEVFFRAENDFRCNSFESGTSSFSWTLPDAPEGADTLHFIFWDPGLNPNGWCFFWSTADELGHSGESLSALVWSAFAFGGLTAVLVFGRGLLKRVQSPALSD